MRTSLSSACRPCPGRLRLADWVRFSLTCIDTPVARDPAAEATWPREQTAHGTCLLLALSYTNVLIPCEGQAEDPVLPGWPPKTHLGTLFAEEARTPTGSRSKWGRHVASLKLTFQKDFPGVSLHLGGCAVDGNGPGVYRPPGLKLECARPQCRPL